VVLVDPWEVVFQVSFLYVSILMISIFMYFIGGMGGGAGASAANDLD
jgi:hypothetical protein